MMEKNKTRLVRVILGCMALGLASMLVVLVLLFIFVGGKQASHLIFGYSPALYIFGLGAFWYPFVNKRME